MYSSPKLIQSKKHRNVFFQKTLVVVCFLFSLIFLVAWFFNLEPILRILPSDATMKFNTVLVFLLVNINLAIIFKKNKYFHYLYRLLLSIPVFIDFITLLEYTLFPKIRYR